MKNSKLWRWWNDFSHRFWAETLFLLGGALVLVSLSYPAANICGFLMAGAFVIGAVVDYIGWHRGNGVLVILLAASLLFAQMPIHAQVVPPDPSHQSDPSDPQFVGPCMAVVVLVIGAVVIYKLYKFCDKYLPPPPTPPPPATNNIPNPTNNIPTNLPPITVYPSDANMVIGQRSFSMNLTVSPDGSLSLSPLPVNAYWDQDWNTLTYGQWTNALYGNLGAGPNNTTASLAASPQPPAPGSNLQASYTGGVLSVTEVGQPTRTIVLYRSADLLNWSPISTNIWSARFTQVMALDSDAPEQAAFYKVQ